MNQAHKFDGCNFGAALKTELQANSLLIYVTSAY